MLAVYRGLKTTLLFLLHQEKLLQLIVKFEIYFQMSHISTKRRNCRYWNYWKNSSLLILTILVVFCLNAMKNEKFIQPADCWVKSAIPNLHYKVTQIYHLNHFIVILKVAIKCSMNSLSTNRIHAFSRLWHIQKAISNTLPWVFFKFLKLYKWYQIAHNITTSKLFWNDTKRKVLQQ